MVPVGKVGQEVGGGAAGGGGLGQRWGVGGGGLGQQGGGLGQQGGLRQRCGRAAGGG